LAPRAIKLLGEGIFSVKEVADKLGLTENTVNYLWKKTLMKSRMKSRREN
jgi:DNA-binding CsgD family transcriptional regulator